MRPYVSQVTIAVLGASGGTGREVIARALQGGHQVVSLVRRTSGVESPGVREVQWNDVSDTETLTGALAGVDVVISALGGANTVGSFVCTDATRSLVPAMRAAGVQRLIAVSAHGVLESRDRSLYSLATWAGVKEKMKDKEAMERLISSSGLAWTIVRPPMLKNGRAHGDYRSGDQLPIRLWHSISRADLADFLVREAEAPTFVHRRPRIHQ